MNNHSTSLKLTLNKETIIKLSKQASSFERTGTGNHAGKGGSQANLHAYSGTSCDTTFTSAVCI